MANDNFTWLLDNSNDGYPHTSTNDILDFKYFEKNNDGYPKNWYVWKLDRNNDNYPWIVGFIPKESPKWCNTYIIKNGELVNTAPYIIDDNDIMSPISIYKIQ